MSDNYVFIKLMHLMGDLSHIEYQINSNNKKTEVLKAKKEGLSGEVIDVLNFIEDNSADLFDDSASLPFIDPENEEGLCQK